MNAGSRALPWARVPAPASRNSLTSRSCKVLCARSTRPLGRARIGADDIDVQGVQCPAKLRHPVTTERAWMVDPEDAMLVAVERDRFAPGLQISAGCMEIGERRLALDKLQMPQPAGRVINEHQQGALRSAIFEPPMLAAIDLHQFADTLAPVAGLINLLPPLLGVRPSAR